MAKNTNTDKKTKIIPQASKYDNLKRHGPGYIKRRLGLLSNEVDRHDANKDDTQNESPASD